SRNSRARRAWIVSRGRRWNGVQIRDGQLLGPKANHLGVLHQLQRRRRWVPSRRHPTVRKRDRLLDETVELPSQKAWRYRRSAIFATSLPASRNRPTP